MADEKIMIVEDEVVTAMEIQSSLEGMGYCVTSIVDSGEDAIKRAKKDKPNLIFMDIKLSGQIDGIEAADRIRSELGIPVIFLTAFDDENSLNRAKLTMPFGYLLKPVQDKDLYATTSMALYSAKADADRRYALNKLKESEKKMKFLSSSLIFAQEKERKRISIELHDELGQSLLVLKLQLQSIQNDIPKDLVFLRTNCEQSLNYIDEITENVRRLSIDLSPSILGDLGLAAAIRWLLKEMANHHNIDILTDFDNIDFKFPKEDEINVFRVIQEALTNAVKHGQANQISFSLKYNSDNLNITLEDNGKGFDVESVFNQDPVTRGLGLSIMEERLRILGGVFNLSSRQDKGTKIIFEIPLRVIE